MTANLPSRIVCLTEETTETLYLLGEEHRRIERVLALEPDLVIGFSDIQADIARDPVMKRIPNAWRCTRCPDRSSRRTPVPPAWRCTGLRFRSLVPTHARLFDDLVGRRDLAQKRELTAIIEREGDNYVALCPELDIASQGTSIEQARANLKEALELFFETADPAEIKTRLHDEVFVTRVEVAVG